MTAAICAALVAASGAAADFQVSEVTTDMDIYGNPLGGTRAPVANDAYFIAPGIGGAGGFALSGTYATSTFDSAAEVIGTDVVAATISSSESDIASVANVSISSSSGELWPTGFSVGGFPADTGAFFMGINAGGDPLDWVSDNIVNLAIITGYDSLGGVIFAFDITAFGSFTAGPNGSWNGSLGVSFGAGTTGIGVARVDLDVSYSKVPAPGTLALLSLGGLVATRRRR